MNSDSEMPAFRQGIAAYRVAAMALRQAVEAFERIELTSEVDAARRALAIVQEGLDLLTT